MFSSEFCKIFKNTNFLQHLRATASEEKQNDHIKSNVNKTLWIRISGIQHVKMQFFPATLRWRKKGKEFKVSPQTIPYRRKSCVSCRNYLLWCNALRPSSCRCAATVLHLQKSFIHG